MGLTQTSYTSLSPESGQKQSQIKGQLIKLSTQLEELEKAVFAIEERLKDVVQLASPREKKELNKIPEEVVPLTLELQELNDKLENVIDYLNYVHQRIEL